MGYDLSGDVDGIEIVGDLSHIYCTLLASLVIRRLASAAKHPKPATEKAKSLSRLSINVSITHINVHLVYPAGEHMVLYVKVVKVVQTRWRSSAHSSRDHPHVRSQPTRARCV